MNPVRVVLCFFGVHPPWRRQRLEPAGLFTWVCRCSACHRIYRGL